MSSEDKQAAAIQRAMAFSEAAAKEMSRREGIATAIMEKLPQDKRDTLTLAASYSRMKVSDFIHYSNERELAKLMDHELSPQERALLGDS